MIGIIKGVSRSADKMFDDKQINSMKSVAIERVNKVLFDENSSVTKDTVTMAFVNCSPLPPYIYEKVFGKEDTFDNRYIRISYYITDNDRPLFNSKSKEIWFKEYALLVKEGDQYKCIPAEEADVWASYEKQRGKEIADYLRYIFEMYSDSIFDHILKGYSFRIKFANKKEDDKEVEYVNE